MLRRLQQAIATGEYLMLYMDPDDTGKFCYGRVLAADEDFVALYLIAPDGAYDGLLVKETGSVQRIGFGGQYDAKMRKLMQGVQLPDWQKMCSTSSTRKNLKASLYNSADRRPSTSLPLCKRPV